MIVIMRKMESLFHFITEQKQEFDSRLEMMVSDLELKNLDLGCTCCIFASRLKAMRAIRLMPMRQRNGRKGLSTS